MIPRQFNVNRLSAVADLTGHGPVASLVVHFGDVGMAGRAGFVSRIDQRPGGICINRGGSVMAQSAEGFGDEVMPCTDQNTAQDQEDDRKTV